MPAHQHVVVRELEREERADATRVLTDAFLDDPAWLAIGPRSERYRRGMLTAYHRVVIFRARRFGGRVLVGVRDGQLAGVGVAFPAGAWPPPEPWSTLMQVPVFVAVGPGPGMRAVRVDALMERGHPPEPHLYLELLAVAPRLQRTGIGRALLERLLSDADAEGVPLHLETARPENLPYYRGFGLEVTSEAALPRGAPMWFMSRPPSAHSG
jgi:ribosomal protein S18 acetylase RimI-like enzyme